MRQHAHAELPRIRDTAESGRLGSLGFQDPHDQGGEFVTAADGVDSFGHLNPRTQP